MALYVSSTTAIHGQAAAPRLVRTLQPPGTDARYCITYAMRGEANEQESQEHPPCFFRREASPIRRHPYPHSSDVDGGESNHHEKRLPQSVVLPSEHRNNADKAPRQRILQSPDNGRA